MRRLTVLIDVLYTHTSHQLMRTTNWTLICIFIFFDDENCINKYLQPVVQADYRYSDDSLTTVRIDIVLLLIRTILAQIHIHTKS